MRRDSIFYQLFQQFPTCLFELIGSFPDQAEAYRFASVTVKETAFQLDGILLPPAEAGPGTIYFLEVQFQKDEQFYERFFSELFIYLYRHRSTIQDWQAVVLYPTRKIEQRDISLYQPLLASRNIHCIYLDEIPDTGSLPLNLMKLMITNEADTPNFTRLLVEKIQAEPVANRTAIIELLTTIMVYKFANLSREEIEAMLGFTASELKTTRFYQEVKQEGRQEGLQAGRQEGLQAGRQEGLQAGRQEGEQIGWQKGELDILIRLLRRRFGVLPSFLEAQVAALPQAQLEALAESIFDFNQLEDIQAWLKAGGKTHP